MISKKHKFIFVHIPKCAGTSIEKALGHYENKYNIQDHRKMCEYEKISEQNFISSLRDCFYLLRNYDKNNRSKHHKRFMNSLQMLFYSELNLNEFNSFYKFSIVRNSWSRIYSWYNNVLRDVYLRNLYEINQEISLYEFVKNKIVPSDFNQIDYLKDRHGDFPLNFIGRFENIEVDFKFVCEQLGLGDVHLPKILVSNSDHYTNYYDNKTIDLVYENFKDEINKFNFTYGE